MAAASANQSITPPTQKGILASNQNANVDPITGAPLSPVAGTAPASWGPNGTDPQAIGSESNSTADNTRNAQIFAGQGAAVGGALNLTSKLGVSTADGTDPLLGTGSTTGPGATLLNSSPAAQQITADYQKYFGRTPDAAGLAYWENPVNSANGNLAADILGGAQSQDATAAQTLMGGGSAANMPAQGFNADGVAGQTETFNPTTGKWNSTLPPQIGSGTNGSSLSPTNSSSVNPATLLGNPTAWNVANDQTVQGQMQQMIDPNNPYYQQWATTGKEQAAQNGFTNGSLQQTGILNSVMANATPIATADAATAAKAASYNADQRNQFAVANQNASNNLNLGNLQANTSITNTNSNNATSIANTNSNNATSIANTNTNATLSANNTAANNANQLAVTGLNNSTSIANTIANNANQLAVTGLNNSTSIANTKANNDSAQIIATNNNANSQLLAANNNAATAATTLQNAIYSINSSNTNSDKTGSINDAIDTYNNTSGAAAKAAGLSFTPMPYVGSATPVVDSGIGQFNADGTLIK